MIHCVCVCMPYMYIMQLSSSCCFDQLTLSVNPYSLDMLLTSSVKPGTKTVSLSLFTILPVNS